LCSYNLVGSVTQTVDPLCDMGLVESCFGPFRDSVSVGADRCTVCTKRPYA
jgi:hypothetical protein